MKMKVLIYQDLIRAWYFMPSSATRAKFTLCYLLRFDTFLFRYIMKNILLWTGKKSNSRERLIESSCSNKKQCRTSLRSGLFSLFIWKTWSTHFNKHCSARHQGLPLFQRIGKVDPWCFHWFASKQEVPTTENARYLWPAEYMDTVVLR